MMDETLRTAAALVFGIGIAAGTAIGIPAATRAWLRSRRRNTPGAVPRRDNLTEDHFLEQYCRPGRPVVLTSFRADWRAMSHWSPAYLETVCGAAPTEIMTGREADASYEINLEAHRTTIPFRDYVRSILHNPHGNDRYLVANNHFLETPGAQTLYADFLPLPKYLDETDIKGKVFIWFGAAGTLTPLHYDTTDILFVQVYGRKRWKLISPEQSHLLYNTIGVYSDVDCEKPDYVRFPLYRDVDVHELELRPGDALFLPAGWWHHVRGLSISISLSFTNFKVGRFAAIVKKALGPCPCPD